MSEPLDKELARCVELTLSAPDATRADIEKLCTEARGQQILAVCVNGSRVELARALLEEGEVQVVALVGFPLGAVDTDAKRYETEIAVDQGAYEIDFVINHGWLKDGDQQRLLREMRDIVEAADERIVKAVVEAASLTDEELALVCRLAEDAGVKFISTSADFHGPAATAELVRRVLGAAGDGLDIKAAGRVRDVQTVAALIEAGAARVGAQIVQGSKFQV